MSRIAVAIVEIEVGDKKFESGGGVCFRVGKETRLLRPATLMLGPKKSTQPWIRNLKTLNALQGRGS